ncbi:SAM-dependent methyltransferase [Streptomyces inusitatus]|uniref:SAM-dependent methyltransferase n=1 Tax=Streptomyces inusitatus TaxID=68221 RepID=A0A918Q5U0_9ACTN|nr:class I SAM-dependent methyltransferase [Streptomyces inusitatus]GGZ33018.1 SAM-dependent methyltransferase [Streptomyces inusitatus]
MSRHHHHHNHTSTQPDWDAMGPLLESKAEVESPLYRQAAAWLGELTPPAGVRRVLDVGSGPGVLTTLLAEAFPAAETVAVDPTPQLLERARARAERAGVADRFQALRAQLPGDLSGLGSADLVWAGNMVHHVGDQRTALADLGALLRPGGVLAVVEGGLPTRRLPRDLGIGRPGLEARVDAAHSEWFAAMRADLPGVKDVVEDWPALLAAAGLTPSGSRTFLLDIPAPAPAPVREHHVAFFERLREAPGGLLTDEDLAVIDRLLDPHDPEGLLNRADTFLLTAHTVHTARR